MHLSVEQEQLLRGSAGQGMALALETLVRFGEAFGAARLVPVTRAHLVGSFGLRFFHRYLQMLERLVQEGVRVRVPTTVNPRPGREVSWLNRFLYSRQSRLESLFAALGVTPTYSCAFYHREGEPRLGDVLAWAESSAVVYANSVLGARTNLNSLGIDLCSAVTGLTPEFGLLLPEKRAAQVLVRLSARNADPGALGFVLGQKVPDRIPVLTHHPFSRADLKALGAGMAVSGRSGMFHVEGLTPEAPDLATALQGPRTESVEITQSEVDAVSSRPRKADLVVLGCPHLSQDEARAMARDLGSSQVRTPTLALMAPADLEQFRATEEFRCLDRAGVRFDSFCPLAGYSARIGTRTIVSPSAKLRYYLKGSHHVPREECLS